MIGFEEGSSTQLGRLIRPFDIKIRSGIHGFRNLMLTDSSRHTVATFFHGHETGIRCITAVAQSRRPLSPAGIGGGMPLLQAAKAHFSEFPKEVTWRARCRSRHSRGE